MFKKTFFFLNIVFLNSAISETIYILIILYIYSYIWIIMEHILKDNIAFNI